MGPAVGRMPRSISRDHGDGNWRLEMVAQSHLNALNGLVMPRVEGLQRNVREILAVAREVRTAVLGAEG